MPRVGNGFVFEGEEQVDAEPLGPGAGHQSHGESRAVDGRAEY